MVKFGRRGKHMVVTIFLFLQKLILVYQISVHVCLLSILTVIVNTTDQKCYSSSVCV